jgi:hypothetical protein
MSITSSLETPTALSGLVDHDTRPGHIHATIRVNRLGVAVKTTSGDTSRRTIGGTVIRTRLPFAAIVRASYQSGSSRRCR